MRHVYRADASPEIGAGHVMRISALAEESILRGIETVFIGKIENLPWVNSRLKNMNFSSRLSKQEKFNNNSTDILIVDSYKITNQDQIFIEKNWFKVVTIFDEYTPDYRSDLRIHSGLKEKWTGANYTKTLSGPKFIPIRKSITQNIKKIESQPVKIIISGGASDANGFTSAMTECLRGVESPFHAYVLNRNSKIHDDERFTYLKMGAAFDSIIREADLVFTLAGTSVFEFLAAGLPVAVACSVENQLSNYYRLGDNHIALPIGMFDRTIWKFDHGAVLNIMGSREVRSTLKQNAIGLIDLLGAERILNEICKT
jgi:spore coat polysaccharide biosynthesis predicted glycosyltransferase SpsG